MYLVETEQALNGEYRDNREHRARNVDYEYITSADVDDDIIEVQDQVAFMPKPIKVGVGLIRLNELS